MAISTTTEKFPKRQSAIPKLMINEGGTIVLVVGLSTAVRLTDHGVWKAGELIQTFDPSLWRDFYGSVIISNQLEG